MTTDDIPHADFEQPESGPIHKSALGTFVLAAIGFAFIVSIVACVFGHWVLYG
ncbi:MAG TPA: hypothetical protein VN701_00785 [Candidatus Paceibacterota bacterium]|nr:hypothetical protein [Candidatus Paceibacterota bacterium]